MGVEEDATFEHKLGEHQYMLAPTVKSASQAGSTPHTPPLTVNEGWVAHKFYYSGFQNKKFDGLNGLNVV